MRETKRTSGSALLPWKLLLVVVVGALLLTGCVAEKEITFYEGKGWEYVAQMSIPLAMMPPGAEDKFKGAIRELKGEVPGVEISWRHERVGENMVFYLTARGEGWEPLNKIVFGDRAEITRKNGEVSIYFRIPWDWHGVVYSLTVHAGEIISSNADDQRARTAVWHEPTGSIEAVFIEKAPNGLGVLLLLLGLLVVGGGGAAVFVKTRKQKFSKGRAAVTDAVCPQCGTANSFEDRFCQNCGAGLKA